MSQRLEPFLNENIYHVFNRTIDKRNIFKNPDLCLLILKLFNYYRSSKAKISYSKLRTLDKLLLAKLLKLISYEKHLRVEILAYCLMPTHFHLLIKQKKEKGVQKFLANTINSLTRYFNLKNNRVGPLFLPKFKSVSIHTDEQLMHVSRYIHLNPYSSKTVNRIGVLFNYPWSSLQSYLSVKQQSFINTNQILGLFGNDKTKYKQFILSNAEYQKTLEETNYLNKW